MLQNKERNSALLIELLFHRNIIGTFKVVITQNGSDMCSAMVRLNDTTNIKNNLTIIVNDVYVRCLTHVVNLAVRYCLY